MNEKMTKAYFSCKNTIYNFLHKENGEANIVAIILVLAIVVLLAVVFRRYIANIFNNVWSQITDNLSGSESSDHDFSAGVGNNTVSAIRNLFV